MKYFLRENQNTALSTAQSGLTSNLEIRWKDSHFERLKLFYGGLQGGNQFWRCEASTGDYCPPLISHLLMFSTVLPLILALPRSMDIALEVWDGGGGGGELLELITTAGWRWWWGPSAVAASAQSDSVLSPDHTSRPDSLQLWSVSHITLLLSAHTAQPRGEGREGGQLLIVYWDLLQTPDRLLERF